MHFNLVDGAVLAVCAIAVLDGARRGFPTYATELTAFALGLGVAFLLFEPISGALHALLGVPLGLAGFGTFLVLLVVTHGAVQASLHPRLEGLVRRVRLTPRAGAVPALGTAVLLAALVLSALVVLPAGGYRSLVLASTSGSALTRDSNFLAPGLRRLLVPANRESQGVLVPQVAPDAGENAFYKLSLPDQLETTIDAAAEARMLALVNQVRAQNHLPGLTPDPALQAAARDHSLDMYQRKYFSHMTPDGKNPFDRMREHQARFVTAGENIAFAPDVDQAEESLLASPDHKANILNADFHCVGIGVYRAPGYEEMFTQDFTDCG